MRVLFAFLATVGVLAAQGTSQSTGSPSSWDPSKGPPDAWVYLVFSGYEKNAAKLEAAARRWGSDAEEAVKALPSTLGKSLAAESGVPADAIDFSRPFAMVVFNPMGGAKPALLMPVRPGLSLSADKKPTHGYFVLGEGNVPTYLTQVLEAAGPGAIVAPSGVVQVHIDFGTIYQVFGPMLQMSVQQSMRQTAADPNAAKLAMEMMGGFFSVLGQIQDLSLNLDLAAGDILANVRMKAKDGSELAQLSAMDGGGTALGSLLEGNTMSFSGKSEAFLNWGLRIYESMLATQVPDAANRKAMLDAMVGLRRHMGDEFAVTQDFGEGGLSMDLVSEFTGKLEDLRSQYRAMMSLRSTGGTTATGPEGMGFGKVSMKENVRQSGGVTVDAVSNSLVGKVADPAQMKALQSMFGPNGTLEGEYAVIDGLFVMSMGGKDYARRLDAIIAKARAPRGTPSAAPLNFRWDMVRVLAWASRLQGGDLGPLPRSVPMSGQLRFAERTFSCDLTLPIDAILGFRDVIQRMPRPATPAGAPR